jgi:ABC-type multidrug transport system fused ATPase/permease subunit
MEIESEMTSNRSFLISRLDLLRDLRYGGFGTVSGLIGIGLIGALLPAATALAIKSLVLSLLNSPRRGIGPLVVLGVVIIVGRLAQVALVPVQHRALGRLDGARRAGLARLASVDTSIDTVESAGFQELLRVARADPDFWGERTPGQGATALLDLLLRWIGVLAAAVVLATFEWWLAPLIIIPAWACRAIWRKQLIEHIEIERAKMPDGIESGHWQKTAVEWTGGKEPRTFGLGKWAIDRSMRHRHQMLDPIWGLGLRSVAQQWQIVAIAGPPLLASFTLVVWIATDNPNRIAAAAAVLAASWAILNLLGFADALEIEGAMPGVQAYAQLVASYPPIPTPRMAAVAGDSLPERAPVVRFENVSFSYPGRDQRVLDGVDLEVRSGELLALVGLNGAGKSTLIKLLSGLYRPLSGRITADGVDLADIDGWRGQISVVFQDFVRYPLSLLDNVAAGYAASPVDREKAESAARDAGLDKLIAELPNGWETFLSRTRRGGVDLSGGQWQLVVLARAMYALRCGARILVLDEPTAHLDVTSEFEVFQRLSEHRAQASVLLISHRLSTVRLADRIVLLNDGRIVESGNHADLMAENGMYASLFVTQARRFNEGYNDAEDVEVEEELNS